jgi:hypothetical protein
VIGEHRRLGLADRLLRGPHGRLEIFTTPCTSRTASATMERRRNPAPPFSGGQAMRVRTNVQAGSGPCIDPDG